MAKLSEIKGDAVMDVVADLTGAVASIYQDDKCQAIFKNKKTPKGMTKEQFFASKVKDNVPYLIKEHKDDVIQILASLNQVDPAEYKANMTLQSLIADVFDVINDKELVAFLSSLGETPKA